MQHKNESVNTPQSGPENHEGQPKVVLEIGVGTWPIFPEVPMIASRDGRQPQHFPPEERLYVGIDLPIKTEYPTEDDESYELRDPDPEDRRVAFEGLAALQRALRRHTSGEAISTAAADARNLPFANESIDEVYMGDVVGSVEDPETFLGMASEVSRVLKPGGHLIIRETVTPEAASIDALGPVLSHFGLDIRERVQGRDTARYQELQQQYGVSLHELETEAQDQSADTTDPSNMYFAIAEKVPAATTVN